MKLFLKILSVAGALSLASCAPQWKAPKTSPDGTLTLLTSMETSHQDENAYGCVVVEVQDKSEKVVMRDDSYASAFKSWDIAWISNDAFKLTSSDNGVHTWTRQPDGKWKRE